MLNGRRFLDTSVFYLHDPQEGHDSTDTSGASHLKHSWWGSPA